MRSSHLLKVLHLLSNLNFNNPWSVDLRQSMVTILSTMETGSNLRLAPKVNHKYPRILRLPMQHCCSLLKCHNSTSLRMELIKQLHHRLLAKTGTKIQTLMGKWYTCCTVDLSKCNNQQTIWLQSSQCCLQAI
jgi:hypothetical protein